MFHSRVFGLDILQILNGARFHPLSDFYTRDSRVDILGIRSTEILKRCQFRHSLTNPRVCFSR